jgi:exodeoxyribonuclease-5
MEIAAMSFMGSASLVMRMKGLINAKTSHSWIYDVKPVPMRDKNGEIVLDKLLNVPILIPKFIPVTKLDDNIKLIVIDEGFCMPMKLRKDIEKFGIKILVCGDPNQLPPVNDAPAFLTGPNCYRLTKCMRQAGREDIAFIANRAKLGLPLLNGYYGNSLVINREDLTDDMLLWADAVICCKNKTRDILNRKIRSIKGYIGKLPKSGEKVVCRSNNWLEGVSLANGQEINLTNGLIGTVLNNPDISSYDGKMFSMTFSPDLAPNVIFKNSRCNYKHMISDYETRTHIRENRYETGNMFEFAYAITAHISQGSQFHKVVYIEESMNPSIQGSLNLVGASRADTALIYVKNSR